MIDAKTWDRWHSLTLSPADRAILDQMEEELGRIRDPGADGRSPDRVPDRGGLDVAVRLETDDELLTSAS